MKPRIDPSSRLVVDEPRPLVPRASTSPGAFVELCARTSFSGITIEGYGAVEGRSLLDARAAWPGSGLPEEVVARAALFGQDVVAITDLDTVAGVVRAHAAGRALGVRVIPGCELLLDEGSLVLLPMTAAGWANLCSILTLARDGLLQRGVSKDDVDHRLDVVLRHADDLHAIAWPPFASRALPLLREAFGARLSLGVTFTETPEDAVSVAFAQRWSQRLSVPIVLSARPLLVDAADRSFHDVLCALRQHLLVDAGGQRLLPNASARLCSHDEIRARALLRAGVDSDVADAWLARSREIASEATFQLGQLKYAFPVDDADPNGLLRARTLEGARERYPRGVPDDVRAQLEHELALVRDIDVAPYFLTVKDIVDVARARGILCQGRGSAANSAVCYCLGITSIDPVRMGLLFERFLSKERGEPPDIDVDFEHERREEVIQEIYARWGRDHAAMVSEVISFRGRSAVREVGKAHGLSEVVTGRIAELMLHGSFRELAESRSSSSSSSQKKPSSSSSSSQKKPSSQPQGRRIRGQGDRGAVADVVREAGVDVDDPAVRRTLQMALRLQGHPRHLGIHVGGFVLTRQPITTLAPVEPARMAGRAVLPWDKDDVDELGLFKMDVLGLGMLTCIRKGIALVNARLGLEEGAPRSSSLAAPMPDGQSVTTPHLEYGALGDGAVFNMERESGKTLKEGVGEKYSDGAGKEGQTREGGAGRTTTETHLDPTRALALHTIPAEDSRVYDMLCAADTIGVFQVESRAQMSMLPRLKPRCFYDLVVQVAIIRPGPIQGGMVHPYLRRRSGEEPVEYPHDSVRAILERTLGVPLFQEQVMKLAVVGAGYSPGEADQLRRDMAAWRKTGRLERHRARLTEGFQKTGIDADFADRLYEQIKGFGEYGFPESHAASFAILVYASAWLKRFFPAEFACALLNSLPMGFYAPAQIVSDAQRHGVGVRAVDVNASDWDCVLEVPAPGDAPPVGRGDDCGAQVGLDVELDVELDVGRALRLGLRLVKGLREDVARALVAERVRAGPYADVADVNRRARLDKRARLALARAGAFDLLAGHRRAALWAALDPRPPLFARLRDEQPSLPLPSEGELLALDYAHTGLSVDDHPMRHVRPGLVSRLAARSSDRRAPPLLDSRGVQTARHGTRALLAGLVIGRQRPGTADGTCFVTLEDEHGAVNVIIWGRDFDRWRATVVAARFLLVDATIERQGAVVHAIARAVSGVRPSADTFSDDRGAAPAASQAQLAFPFAARNFH